MMPPAAHCRFSADPDACSAPDAPHPTKKIQRSPAGRDQSTGADSSLCNRSGSSSTLKRLVCASPAGTLCHYKLQSFLVIRSRRVSSKITTFSSTGCNSRSKISPGAKVTFSLVHRVQKYSIIGVGGLFNQKS